MNNGDKLRSMSDEELAELLSGENPFPWCTQEPCSGDCKNCILAWLKT